MFQNHTESSARWSIVVLDDELWKNHDVFSLAYENYQV